MYSASLAARWRDQPHWFRVVAAPLIIDPTWLAVEQRTGPPRSLQDERPFFLGAGLTLITAWCTLVSAGMILGSRAGGSIGLDVAVPLCLLTVVAPRLLDRRSAPVVVTAGVVAAVTTAWAAGFGLLVASRGRGRSRSPVAQGPVMTAWLVIVAVGLGSYALRVGPLLLRDRFEPSPATDDLIRHAGTAALSALAVTSVLRVSAGGLSASTMASLLVGAALALRGASMRRVVVAGLASQWGIQLALLLIS